MMISLSINLLIIGLLSTGIPTVFTSDNDESSKLLCGGEFELETTVQLKLPDNPNITVCEWKLNAHWSKKIAISFHSFRVDDQDNCMFNYISVRNGNSDDGELMGVFCGNNLPPELRTMDSSITIKLVMHNPKQRPQFSATVFTIFDECQNETPQLRNPFKLSKKQDYENSCGKDFGPTETNAVIQSPCFPGVYPRNKKCVWNIEAPLGEKVKLKFNHFDIYGKREVHEKKECENANVEVFNMQGDDKVTNSVSLCGSTIPETIISEGNTMRVVFTSSPMYNHVNTGFSAEFSHQK